EDPEPPPELARVAAGVPPSVVRSGVGPLHRVSTWSLFLPTAPLPCLLLGPGSLSAYYRVERLASIWEPAKGCLVLLLSGLSGSGTMNDSPCVSTLTTTRRRRWPPMLLIRLHAFRARCSATRRAFIISANRPKRRWTRRDPRLPVC